MQMKKVICTVLSCVLVMGSVTFHVNAAEVQNAAALENFSAAPVNPCATESFSITISAKAKSSATSSFPLVAGETITIRAYYAPSDASVDFGVVAPDGKYYYFNTTSGNIDKTITVNQSGDYYLLIRNNSDSAVKVSGFVNY